MNLIREQATATRFLCISWPMLCSDSAWVMEACVQVRNPSLGPAAWEWRIRQYAALGEGIAAQPQHADVECVRVNAKEVAASASQHAQEWVELLLEAVHSQELAHILVSSQS